MVKNDIVKYILQQAAVADVKYILQQAAVADAEHNCHLIYNGPWGDVEEAFRFFKQNPQRKTLKYRNKTFHFLNKMDTLRGYNFDTSLVYNVSTIEASMIRTRTEKMFKG